MTTLIMYVSIYYLGLGSEPSWSDYQNISSHHEILGPSWNMIFQSIRPTVSLFFSITSNFTSHRLISPDSDGYIYTTRCPVKLFPLGYFLFYRLLLMQIAKVGTFLKNSGNLLHDRHKNFENWFWNSWDNWGQSCHL